MRNNECYMDEDSTDISPFNKYVESELIRQGNKLFLSNSRKSATNISSSGCHIDLIVALNTLISALLYLCNCYSNSCQNIMHDYDKAIIEERLFAAEVITKRIKYVM